MSPVGVGAGYRSLAWLAHGCATALTQAPPPMNSDTIMGGGAWLRNSFNTGAATHELGHNYGLNHANFWDTSGQSVIGPGASVEQGDYFDTMGFALAGNNHFNARYKSLLGWIPTNSVTTVTTSGTYRVFAHDDPITSGTRALVIPR